MSAQKPRHQSERANRWLGKTELAKTELAPLTREKRPKIEKPKEPEPVETAEILRRADNLSAAMFEIRIAEAMGRGVEGLKDEAKVEAVREVLRDLNATQEIREAKPCEPPCEHLEDLGDRLGLTEQERREGKITNQSFVLRLVERMEELDAVYKPTHGEKRDLLRGGIEQGSLYKREWLAFMVDRALELGLVPPTVLRQEDKGIGSVQKWIEGGLTAEEAPDRKPKSEDLIKLALLDYLIGNQDRFHGRNHLVTKDGKIYAIDNGLSFGTGLYDQEGKEFFSALHTVSKPLEQTRESDPAMQSKMIMGHLKIFWQSQERRRVLKEAFNFALGEEAEEVWAAFLLRVQETLEKERLPSDHDIKIASNQMRVSLAHEATGMAYRKSMLPAAVRAA